jgi:DNA polymerase III gamma/tau subunit
MTLHTKYRPESFQEVVGQDLVIAALQAVLKEKRSQTFLFHGPSGTGKTTLARLCALGLGCVPGQSIIEFDAATYTGIDDMREIVATNLMKPLGGGNRAIIIDEAHRLSAAAWASMLKTLEEPQPWLYWFLCTTELGKVPANIKTRCTAFELRLVDQDTLFELLNGIVEKERLTIEDGILDLCAREAGGSPRQAIVNLGMCLHAQGRQDAAALLKSAVDSSEVIDLCRALAKREPWLRVKPILSDLQSTNPESIKAVVCAYMSKVLLGAANPRDAGLAAEVLSAFISTPFSPGSGFAPVLVACAKVLL